MCVAAAVAAEVLAVVFAVVLAEILAEAVAVDVLADVAADVLGRTELEARVEIRQPEELEAEELEVFGSLRLSVVFAAEVLVELAGGTELV